MKKLLDLGYRECRYAVSEDRPWQFCGAETDAGESYCPSHRAVAYVPTPRLRMKASRIAWSDRQGIVAGWDELKHVGGGIS